MKDKIIYLDRQNFPYKNYQEDIDNYRFLYAALGDAGVSTKSNLVNQFEVELSNYFNVHHNNIIATNSGTSALHLAIKDFKYLGNNVVILPIITFIATANAISYCKYKLKFVDVDEKTWCINQSHILSEYNSLLFYEKIKNNVSIVYVDLYGNISPILNVKENNYFNYPKIIVDASHSFGLSPDISRLNKVNYFTYSFNGNKIMTTGAGGAILRGNLGSDYNEVLRRLSQQGKDDNDEFIDVGYNYRMGGINAALGLMQLEYIDFLVKKKSRINEIYRKELKDIVVFQESEPYVKPVWWLTACLFQEGIDIDKLKEDLYNKYRIETRRIFKPLNQYKPYLSNKKYPIAEMIYNRGLCLPSSTLNSDEDIYYVCKTIKNILGERQ